MQDKTDISLEKVHLICSKFAFESFLKQQEDLVVSGTYEVLAYKAFNKLLKCHHGTFVDLMQHTVEYILKNGIMPELTTKNIIEQQAKFKTINIDNSMDYNNLIIPEVKRSHGRSSNNKHIRSIKEDKENKPPTKKASTKPKSVKKNKMSYLTSVRLDIHISQNAVLQVHNLAGDESGTSQEYWFYAPEYAQLASDTYNMLVIVFGANPNASLLFLPFEQKPGLRRKPSVLQ
ncbi:37982_t:CDS:2 [Gigaspora margarita]|uniref:37982_t:CDS:1 n=1 Tax=Gigaspora margarita TaxID=4874 RepID=A0ABN7VL18_GIGMA|nr:37982_t:CDS:2 [Gigaspora margarita]